MPLAKARRRHRYAGAAARPYGDHLHPMAVRTVTKPQGSIEGEPMAMRCTRSVCSAVCMRMTSGGARPGISSRSKCSRGGALVKIAASLSMTSSPAHLPLALTGSSKHPPRPEQQDQPQAPTPFHLVCGPRDTFGASGADYLSLPGQPHPSSPPPRAAAPAIPDCLGSRTCHPRLPGQPHLSSPTAWALSLNPHGKEQAPPPAWAASPTASSTSSSWSGPMMVVPSPCQGVGR